MSGLINWHAAESADRQAMLQVADLCTHWYLAVRLLEQHALMPP